MHVCAVGSRSFDSHSNVMIVKEKTGPHGDKQPFSLTFTPGDNLASPITDHN